MKSLQSPYMIYVLVLALTRTGLSSLVPLLCSPEMVNEPGLILIILALSI